MHLHFIQSNINWILIEKEIFYINFTINDIKVMFLLIWSKQENEFYAKSEIWKQSERERNINVILNITLTDRITLYNKATFVALIAQLQLYVFSNSVKI